ASRRTFHSFPTRRSSDLFWVDETVLQGGESDPERLGGRRPSGVHHPRGLVAGAGEGVAVEDLDGGDDAEPLLDGGLASVTHGVRVLRRGRLLDAHAQWSVLLRRLDHDVLERGLTDVGERAQRALELGHLEALALAREQVLEPPAP